MAHCNATHPHGGDFPARCARIPGHDGPHRAGTGIVSMARIDPDIEWDIEPVVAEHTAAGWRRVLRRNVA